MFGIELKEPVVLPVSLAQGEHSLEYLYTIEGPPKMHCGLQLTTLCPYSVLTSILSGPLKYCDFFILYDYYTH